MSEHMVGHALGPSAADITAFVRALALPSPVVDDRGRIDLIAAMEQLKSALSAAQARVTVAFKASQEEHQIAAGVPVHRVGRDVGAQIALARRVSPWKGDRLVGFSEALVEELPETLAAMTAGECPEQRACIVARETAFLAPPFRAEVDAAMGPRLATLSDRQVEAQTRTHAYRLDPVGYTQRCGHAAADRFVSFRPAPDTMVQMSALLPLREGVATQKALLDAAAAAQASGDERSRSQVMADTLFQRVTGAESPGAIPVEIDLVMSDQALLGDDSEPAQVPGYGPAPAPLARRWLIELPDDTQAWVRRLFVAPDDGRLVALDSLRRRFDGQRRKALIVRDQFCRTPFCNAPIRHGDHVVPFAEGGGTSDGNGQGLCEHCNYVKSLPGWVAAAAPRNGAGVAVTVTTPTGHVHTSAPPPLPRPWIGPATSPRGGAGPPGNSDRHLDGLPIRHWQCHAEVYYRPRFGHAA